MTINANIKADACPCPYPIHFLRACPGVFRDRHLQFVLSIGGYFSSRVDKWRKRTNTIQLFEEANGPLVIRGRVSFEQWFALEDIARSEVPELCFVYELRLRRKHQQVKLIGLLFKCFSDSREEMS
jgi:hypothetical protein